MEAIKRKAAQITPEMIDQWAMRNASSADLVEAGHRIKRARSYRSGYADFNNFVEIEDTLSSMYDIRFTDNSRWDAEFWLTDVTVEFGYSNNRCPLFARACISTEELDDNDDAISADWRSDTGVYKILSQNQQEPAELEKIPFVEIQKLLRAGALKKDRLKRHPLCLFFEAALSACMVHN